jgi:signal transduction histidine kinase/ligand-binding sensor domain-containing protein
MARALLRSAVVLIAAAACGPRAYALDPSRTLSQYVHRIWQVQQGLPQASIYAIVQTHDGFLWLGTQTGLVKFDGVRFTAVDEIGGVRLANTWVTHLVEDEQGTLWIGTDRAGVIRVKRGRATRFGEPEGLPAGAVQCLFADRRGAVWACTPGGLAELARDRVRIFGVADGLAGANVHAACVAPDGAVIAGVDDAQLARWDGTRFRSRPIRLPDAAAVQSMLCADDGAVWIGTSDGLVRVRGNRDDRLTTANGLADDSILALAQAGGAVFAGTKNGFSRIRGDEIESFRPQDGLSQSTVYSVYEDREGSLWVATKHGLNHFFDGRAIPYTTSEGLPSNNTGPVLEDRRGAIWVGTLGGGLARYDGHRFVTLTTRDGLASNTIHALAEGDSGDLWVGTDRGLNRLRDGRIAGAWTTRQGLPADSVRALFRDRAGTLWIATTSGAATFRDGRLRREADPRGSHAEPIAAFGEDHARHVLAAPENDSPSMRHADALYEDRDGLLWIGTLGDGLRLVDNGRVFTFSVGDGLFDDDIYGIAEDDRGRLWMACSKGIFSVRRADLRQLAAGTLRRVVSTPYSPLDGLRTIECQSGIQPAIARTADGRLWFSTIRGVLVIDPDRTERRYASPAVAIEEMTVDGERRRPTDVGELPPGRNTVEFGYTGVSFVAPARVTFRYKLDGFDDAWIEAGARRQAFYTNLPPGHFRFRAAACTPDGACSESPAAVAFVILPRFYQRAWFLPACLAALAFAGWGVYQLRIRRLKEHFDLILAERGRIARELHDTLLQGFAGITMAIQAVASRLPPTRERAALDDIVRDAGTALSEARRSLSGLRRDGSSSGFAAAVAQAARQLTESGDVRLKLSLDDRHRTLPPDLEYNLLRIVQEAIANAVKHSGARTVHVAVDGAADRLRLLVKDDGMGFDEQHAPPAGHYGLIGMRERAAQIGADFQLTSRPGRGTTVSVLVQT